MGSGKGQAKRVKNVTVISKQEAEFNKSLKEVQDLAADIDFAAKNLIAKINRIEKRTGLEEIYNGVVVDRDALNRRVIRGPHADDDVLYATFNSRMNEVNDGVLYEDLSILDLNPNVSPKATYYWSTDESHEMKVPNNKVRRDVIIRPFGEKLMVMDYVVADYEGYNAVLFGFKKEAGTASEAVKLANERRDLALSMADQLDEAVKPGRLRTDQFMLDDLNEKLREYSGVLINDPAALYSEKQRERIMKSLGNKPSSGSIAAVVESYDEKLQREFGNKSGSGKSYKANLKGVSSNLFMEQNGKIFKSKKLKKANALREKHIKELDDIVLRKWGVYVSENN